MNKVILINKEVGRTPLESIELFKSNNPEYKNSKFAYAGRLDPMASGLLVILVDEECKKRDDYQNLQKTYEFEFILGVGTDTFDLLGLINRTSDNDAKESDVISAASKFEGSVEQKYPVYSSYHVKGKPLFWWAREGRLDEIEIPSKKVEIYSIKNIDNKEISKANLETEIINKINLVKGDFRQAETIEKWKEYFQNSNKENFMIYKFSAEVGTGTYIRSLVNEIGEDLGLFATTFSIHRTKVGDFTIEK